MALVHKVEIAFATAPYDPSPVWTDVSAYVWAAAGGQVQINRGRDEGTQEITPSQLTISLDNHDGRFTPGYASGAYYPNVVLGKRIRVTTNNGGGAVERFDGYVDSWPMQWSPTAKYGEAQVAASDRLKKLGQQLSADNLISTYYLPSTPNDYWMFGDADGTTVPYNRSGTITQLQSGWVKYPETTGSNILYGNATGPGFDGLSALSIIDDTLSASKSETYVFSETQSLTLCGFFRAVGGDATHNAAGLFNLQNPNTTEFIYLGTAGDGFTYLVENAAGLGYTPTATLPRAFDKRTHHVALVCQGLGVGLGGTLSLYVDGVSVGGNLVPSFALAGGINAQLFTVGQSNDTTGFTQTYVYAHHAIFKSALSGGTIANIAAAGLTGFSGETSLQRVARLAALAGVTAITTGTAGTTSMAPLSGVNNTSYLDLMNQVGDTEDGMLFTQCDGQLRLRPRRDMQNQAVKWTLTNGQYGTDLTFLLDDFGVVNDAIGDRPNGNQVHVTDATSVTAIGTYSQSKTLLTTDDTEVLGWAQWQINTSRPAPRCSQVSVNLLTQTSLINTWLTLELGDRINLSGLPPTAPGPTADLTVQGGRRPSLSTLTASS